MKYKTSPATAHARYTLHKFVLIFYAGGCFNSAMSASIFTVKLTAANVNGLGFSYLLTFCSKKFRPKINVYLDR